MTALLWSAILAMTLFGALASWMLKLASRDLRPGALASDWHLYAGATGYLAAASLNIWVLRHWDLSVVLPLTALTYVWTLLVARAFLKEQLTGRKLIGLGLIVVGVVLVSAT